MASLSLHAIFRKETGFLYGWPMGRISEHPAFQPTKQLAFNVATCIMGSMARLGMVWHNNEVIKVLNGHFHYY